MILSGHIKTFVYGVTAELRHLASSLLCVHPGGRSLLHPMSGCRETASTQVALWLSAISFYLLYCTLKSLCPRVHACVCMHACIPVWLSTCHVLRHRSEENLRDITLSPQHVGSEDWTRWWQQQHSDPLSLPVSLSVVNAKVPASKLISWEKSREKFTNL